VGITGVDQVEPNIHAGIKYLRFVMDRYFADSTIDRLNRGLFALAAYNAGPGRVRQLRAKAQAAGLDPNVWFGNVEVIAAREIGREIDTISATTMDALQKWPWPGNIRELENVLTRALILCPNDTIEPEYLHLADSPSSSATGAKTASPPRHYHESMEAYSRQILEEALRRNEWNQTRTAEELGLQRTYLTKLLRQKGISGRQLKDSSSSSEEEAL